VSDIAYHWPRIIDHFGIVPVPCLEYSLSLSLQIIPFSICQWSRSTLTSVKSLLGFDSTERELFNLI